MMKVPDAASIATIYFLERIMGRKAGPSTGTNVWGVLEVAKAMKLKKQTGSIVTLMCDSGHRYADTYYNSEWVGEHFPDISFYQKQLENFL